MMQTKQWIDRLWHEPPVFLPLLALFHAFLLSLALVNFSKNGGDAQIQHEVAWCLAGLVLSVGVWLLKRWAAIGYLLLAAGGIVLMLCFQQGSFWYESGVTLFPVNALLMLLIFIFYKRFR